MDAMRQRILVVDDDPDVLASLERGLRLSGFEVATAVDGAEALRSATENRPDAIVLDINMPVMDGYATIDWIRSTSPDTRVLALTFEKSEEAMVRALRAGACGFLLKDVSAATFKDALRQVVALGHYHPDEAAHAEDAHIDGAITYERRRERVLEYISEREEEFIRLVCDEAEHTYDAIADLMQVHRRTVDGYRESIFSKFHLKSKTGLVIFAFKWGVVKV